MRHLRLRRGLVAAVSVLALAAAACGTGGDGDEAATTPPAEETESPDHEATTGSEEMDDGQQASEDPFAELKRAAGHVGEEGSALALAKGIAAGAGLEGDVEADAPQLWAQLSTVLQEHVYLAGIAVDTAYSFGPESGEFEAAAGALDENSVELADIIGSAAGDDNREAFLDLWREHIGFFVDYALAAAEDDDEGRQQALDNLSGYRDQAGAFFQEITGGELPADAVSESLAGHIDTLSSAIDALAAAIA